MITPLDDRIVVCRTDEKPTGMIIVPDSCQEDSHTGVIVAVGPGKRDSKTGRRRTMESKVGDNVMFGRYTDWESPGGALCLMQEADIVGILS